MFSEGHSSKGSGIGLYKAPPHPCWSQGGIWWRGTSPSLPSDSPKQYQNPLLLHSPLPSSSAPPSPFLMQQHHEEPSEEMTPTQPSTPGPVPLLSSKHATDMGTGLGTSAKQMTQYSPCQDRASLWKAAIPPPGMWRGPSPTPSTHRLACKADFHKGIHQVLLVALEAKDLPDVVHDSIIHWGERRC